MPIYEYRCPKCDNRFEAFHPVEADSPACPRCGSVPRRVYGSVGVVFRGSGFHATDYRRGGNSEASGDGAAPEGKTSQSGKETATTSE
jgi:putative FmdB family regulatory protein